MEDKVKEYLLLESVFGHELCSRSLISLCWPYSDIFDFGPNNIPNGPLWAPNMYFPLDPHCPPLGLKFVTMYPYRPSLGLPYALHWPKYTLRAPIHPNICCGYQMTPMDSNIPVMVK